MASLGRKKIRPRAALALLLVAVNIAGFFAYFSYWNYPFLYTTREPRRFFWLSAMFTSESYQILQDHPGDIDMLSPTWYSLEENGSISCAREQDNATAQEMLDIINNNIQPSIEVTELGIVLVKYLKCSLVHHLLYV